MSTLEPRNAPATSTRGRTADDAAWLAECNRLLRKARADLDTARGEEAEGIAAAVDILQRFRFRMTGEYMPMASRHFRYTAGSRSGGPG